MRMTKEGTASGLPGTLSLGRHRQEGTEDMYSLASKTGCRENPTSVPGKQHLLHQIASFGLPSVYWQIPKGSDLTFLKLTFEWHREASQDSAYLSGL